MSSRVSFTTALLSALCGGFLLAAALPPLSWWWAALLGVSLCVAALWGRSVKGAMLLATVSGAAFWLPTVSWLTLYLGPVPWLALCVVMVAWWVLFGAGVAWTLRRLATFSWLQCRPWRLVLAQTFAVAGFWVLREQLEGAVPYGGFPWGRLAITQADGPLAHTVFWFGFAGFSALIAFAGVLPVAVIARFGVRLGVSRVWWGIAISCALVLVMALLPVSALPSRGELRVAGVQGNSKSAIFDARNSGSVLADHERATEALLDRLEESGDQVDVIVWPENSAEMNLPENLLASYRIAKLSERAEAPIVLGSVLKHPDGSYTNSSLLWNAEGSMHTQYDKRFPVPFAEYMPNRAFFHALAPSLVDMVQLDYAHGTRAPVMQIPLAQGDTAALMEPQREVRAGIAICFDIIFDQQATAMAASGAEVVFAQSNNADFGRTAQSAQQLSIARLRAIEMGRSLVNISTVGTSAVIDPSGRDLDRLATHTSGALIATVPLVTGASPALQWGSWWAGLWSGFAVAALCAAGISYWPRRARSK